MASPLIIVALILMAGELASCSAAESEPSVADLAATARSLKLAAIFSFVDESFGARSPAFPEILPSVYQHYVTAVPTGRGCDLAEEWLERRTIDLRRTGQGDQACGLAFTVRSGLRVLVRGPSIYQGCIIVRTRADADERDVYLTLDATLTELSCSDRWIVPSPDMRSQGFATPRDLRVEKVSAADRRSLAVGAHDLALGDHVDSENIAWLLDLAAYGPEDGEDAGSIRQETRCASTIPGPPS